MQSESINATLSEQISIFERSLRDLSPSGFSGKVADKTLGLLSTTIEIACHVAPDALGGSIEDLAAKAETATYGRRETAIFLVRALAVEGLLPIDIPQNKISRAILALVDSAAPDIAKYCKTSEKKQGFEKINALKGFHAFVCSNFSVLKNLPADLGEIKNLKNEIYRPFSNKLCQAYLQPYNYALIRAKVESICDQVDKLVDCKDAGFKGYFEELVNDVTECSLLCETHYSFFTHDFISPFVNTIRTAVEAVERTASDRFFCKLTTLRKPPKSAEKRYPLHERDRFITFIIPMVNVGPGIAIDVVAEIDCGTTNQSLILDTEELRLGDVPPGDFALSFRACVVESCHSVRMTVQLEWRQLFGGTDSYVFDIEIEGQDPDVNWSSLEELEPYSLEVAEGSMFVGRAAKVKAIGNKLLKKPIASTYITGQKRIGKTSLARAVLDYVEQSVSSYVYHPLYLEYGEYCTSAPDSTLKALGDSIFSFLRLFLDKNYNFELPDFSVSLAPLNLIAKEIERFHPEKRFVIILDEFDEIHPELYRLGALAETFFSNLRTLAARNNLAFILVGGEKMPFIIGAQGDQLNKFVREPLDFFSRSLEWEEYCQLVRMPVFDLLNWDEAAINEVFTLTNGHPYYTKLLCSKVVSKSISERDTEIIVPDVRRALNNLVLELDTNAFAHLWKDGINAEREQAEVTELKRLRMLVALARSLRSNLRSEPALVKSAEAVRLQHHEIGPILEDFLRRDIVRESNNELHCTIPVFEKWLVEVGITKLIASTLADELEVELKRAEDNAFVNAGEIQALTDRWPIYRAQKVGPEAVRAWLEQVPSFLDQRLMFTLLRHVRFITPAEIEEMLERAHDRFVRPVVGALQIGRRTEKRRDIWITYLGGVGKSSAQYARTYAKVNSVSAECIMEPGTIERRLRSAGDRPKAIVIVDDVIGSGKTLSEGALQLDELCGPVLTNLAIPVLAIAMMATAEGEKKVNSYVSARKMLPWRLYVCEPIADENYAFRTDTLGFWQSEDERNRAKALCVRLGTGLYKDPLGYAGQGLLLVFPETCPNNSLPILYKNRTNAPSWRPLFPRPVS
jgi:hypothetical protein